MKIRKAAMKDAPRILELLNSSENLTGNDELHYKLKHVKEYIKGKTFITFVCEENKNIAGLASINLFHIAEYAEIYNVVVDKNHRKKGIGLKLVLFAEKYLKNKRYEITYSYIEKDNLPMQKLSEKINYEKGKLFYFYSKILK